MQKIQNTVLSDRDNNTTSSNEACLLEEANDNNMLSISESDLPIDSENEQKVHISLIVIYFSI